FDDARKPVNERFQMTVQARFGIGNAHPAPLSEFVLEPSFEHTRDAHDIDLDAAGPIAIDLVVLTERLLRHHAAQPGFFLSFADRCVSRAFAAIDRSLRHDPAASGGRRHKRDLHSILSDSVRDYRRLLVELRHPLLLRGHRLVEARVQKPMEDTVPKTEREYK